MDLSMKTEPDSGVRVSLVIPAYNEAELLPRLLDTVDIARRRFRHGADAVEVIVADNASSDATAEIAGHRGCEVVPVDERRIASARNGGARRATGPVLAFVDADMRIHPETFNGIEDALATGKVVAGATGVRLERMSLGIALTYALFMPLVWALRMDTGVVFCRRADFESVGGYDERRFFGEDVQLFVDLRRLGRPRGQRLVRLRSFKAMASCRKFDIHGDWHYFTDLFRLIPLMLHAPGATNRFAEKYWYGNQRPPDSQEVKK
jgi:glycosyltransferase involved in cell wall biosynthesis